MSPALACRAEAVRRWMRAYAGKAAHKTNSFARRSGRNQPLAG